MPLDEFVDARFQRGAALRRGEIAAAPISRVQIRSDSERDAADHLLDGRAAAGAGEVVGVLAFRQQRESQALAGLEMRQRQVGGAPCRLLAGLVAVEAQDRLVGHLPQQLQLVLGQRGAERRDRAGKADADHGDDVDIAFDHHQRRAVMRGRARHRRGCRDCRPCETAASPASSDTSPATSFFSARPPKAMTRPRAVGDRKHHAVAKLVVGHRDVVAADQQPGLDHVRRRECRRRRDIP